MKTQEAAMKTQGEIEAAIESKQPILIYGDYDVDGTTAIVILKTAIEIELFTGLGEGKTTAPALAERCGGTERTSVTVPWKISSAC